MNRQGDIDIIPQLGGSSAQQSSRMFSHTQHDEYAPARDTSQDASVTIPASAVKSAMNMSNEYWLIGIIIVLIMVVIMLIVYIVRLKNAEEMKSPQPRGGGTRPKPLERDEQAPDRARQNIVSLPPRNVLQDIASTPFIPKSTERAQEDHTEAHDESDKPEDTHDEHDEQEPGDSAQAPPRAAQTTVD